MRILVCAEGTRGDMHPMLALGSACAAAGWEVVASGPPQFAAEAAERGFEFHSTGTDVVALMEQHATGVVRGGLHLLRAQQATTDALLANGFEVTVEAARGVDLVVAAGVHLAAASAAELAGADYRYCVYCPAVLPSAEHGPALLPFQGKPPWVHKALWRLVPWIFLPIRRRVDRKRRALGLGPCGDVLEHFVGARPLLAADAGLAPAPSDCHFDVTCIGALQEDSHAPLPEKLEAFLAAGPPPVYLGFGSMTDPDPDATTRSLVEAVERAGCRAVLSRGWARLGGSALPESVFVTGPVPHPALFRRVAAVVHHGGAGTTTSAARAGAPQVIVPHVLDQYYWAGRVVALGLGPPPVPRKRLSARALAEALRSLLGNEFVAERARLLGAHLRAADPLHPQHRERLLGILRS